MSLFTKIGLFLWALFAPEKAKAEVESIMKEFVRVMLWLLFLTFLLGVAFFAGTYYLGKALKEAIDTAFVSYLLSALITFFITLVTGILIFRFIIRRAIKRIMDKGNHILSSFSQKKV
ncbi:MAG: hypothetical protein K0R51_1750 [Cytophagaceae bacterium]|jgi:uncharacterized protein HemY|nr:hypothetical protein [Cytophagaceae bacterium]